MPFQTRLNKYIASTGSTSRRGADKLIEEGKVKVNGKIVTNPATTVFDKDVIEINNEKIKPLIKEYIIFNKPAGYITSKDDPQKRKTIYDLLPSKAHNLKPAGRLDKDSAGLLILTNDGELIQKLIHPKNKVPKVYKVTVEGKIEQKDLLQLKKGIEIEKGKIAYAEAMIIEYKQGKTTLEVVLYQGYNRQIRRMMDIIKHPVVSLKRIEHACISLTGLNRGKYRYLSRKEISDLHNYLKKIKD